MFFFFNAPLDNPRHASDALAAVMKMHGELAGFNERLRARGLPQLSMRAGINTGDVVVGDSGPPEGTDYTALGDAVNLAARLESANKLIGSCTLIGARTAELIDGEYLLRPVGKIRVVGKRNFVMTYEPLCPTHEATEQQRRLVETTKEVVDLYQAASFAACHAAVTRMEAGGVDGKLLSLYRGLCEEYLRDPPNEFEGQIVLTEK
jgi:adenylate cyclase